MPSCSTNGQDISPARGTYCSAKRFFRQAPISEASSKALIWPTKEMVDGGQAGFDNGKLILLVLIQ